MGGDHHSNTGLSNSQTCAFFFFFKILFIYLWQRERQRQAEGEAGSMQGAQRGTWSRVSRITPQAEGGAKLLGHRGYPKPVLFALNSPLCLIMMRQRPLYPVLPTCQWNTERLMICSTSRYAKATPCLPTPHAYSSEDQITQLKGQVIKYTDSP